MQSKWSQVKDKALNLRRRGNSLGFINDKLGIPKATLSGWFKGLEISAAGKARIDKNWRLRLVSSRKGAVSWHNTQKANRLKDAEDQANITLSNLKPGATDVVELALAMLYLGEGRKDAPNTDMGNSDPLILNFFIAVLLNIYKVPIEKIKADLHLRADQNPVQLKRYWSKAIQLPLKNFKGAYIDKRTVGRPTYPKYKGVCVIHCGHAAVQRKLTFLARLYCERIIKKYLGG